MSEEASPHDHVPNHQLNPVTGYIENPAYPYGFDSARKVEFLAQYRANGLAFYKTCNQMRLAHSTVNKAIRNDPKFREEFERVKREIAEQVETTLLHCALDPKKTVDRIFWLKNHLPEKYSDYKPGGMRAEITIDLRGVIDHKERYNVVEAEIIPEDRRKSDTKE